MAGSPRALAALTPVFEAPIYVTLNFLKFAVIELALLERLWFLTAKELCGLFHRFFYSSTEVLLPGILRLACTTNTPPNPKILRLFARRWARSKPQRPV